MADKNPIITVDLNMFSQDAEAKTTEANKVAKSLASATRHSPKSKTSNKRLPSITLGICRSWAT